MNNIGYRHCLYVGQGSLQPALGSPRRSVNFLDIILHKERALGNVSWCDMNMIAIAIEGLQVGPQTVFIRFTYNK